MVNALRFESDPSKPNSKSPALSNRFSTASAVAKTLKGTIDRFHLRLPIAVAAVVVALLLHLAMEQYLGLVMPLFITFYPAVILVSIVAGFWPGLLATVLSTVAAEYYLIAPRMDFGVEGSSEAALIFFAAMGVFMCALAERYRRNMLRMIAAEREKTALHEALVRSEKLAAVGRMAASVAHEINNPLAAVMNSVFLAEANAEHPESVREYLALADQELHRISHITSQVLGFHRESVRPSRVSIGAIMDEALEIFKTRIRAKRVTVDKQYDHQLQLIAVPGELRQVFANLVANSLDAVTEQGIIKVRISNARRLDQGNSSVRISIADNGRGIEAEAMPNIFQPMYTTKVDTGIGLGLWVSKQIIEKHNGSIRVHSSTKNAIRGTTFSIVLPLSSNS